MKQDVKRVVRLFEAGRMSEADALRRIKELSGREIEGDWLRDYWQADSMDEFVNRICATPIDDWEQIDDAQALVLIGEFLNTEDRGRQDSIQEALSRRYGKAEGTLRDLVHQNDLCDPVEVLAVLKKDTRFYL